MKYSPPPWKQEDTEDGDWIVRMDSAHFVLIGNLEDTCSICHANATLIAASPELYDACAMADYCLDPRNQEIVTDEDRERTIKAIRDAMRKAGRNG